MTNRILAGSIAALVAFAANAQSVEADVKKSAESFLAKMSGGKRIAADSVRESGIAGLYEITFGADILYIDRKGGNVFFGNIYDTKSGVNLTDASKKKLLKTQFSSLPLDLAIKQVRGSGKRVLVTFEDPNCGYCKKLARELRSATDITIYTFLLPILGEDSVEKTKAIWCAPDKVKAWNDYMIEGVAPAVAKCDTPIKKFVELGAKFRISGTPSLFFADGTLHSGYISTTEIDQLIGTAGSGS